MARATPSSTLGSTIALVLVAAAPMAACTRVPATLDLEPEPSPAARPTGARPAPAGDASFDPRVALDEAERALLAVDAIRSQPGPHQHDYGLMHTWLPDEGLRSLYYFATLAQVSIGSMAAVFDTPVFLDGPHAEHPDLQAPSFGGYNPEFVVRVTATAQALARDPARVERTRAAFERQLRRQALTYLLVHRAIHRDPAWYARLRQAELDLAADPSAYAQVWDEIMPMNDAFAAAGMSWYEAGTASSFWVRRDLDGTDALWLSAIEALLGAYGVDTSGEPPGGPIARQVYRDVPPRRP